MDGKCPDSDNRKSWSKKENTKEEREGRIPYLTKTKRGRRGINKKVLNPPPRQHLNQVLRYTTTSGSMITRKTLFNIGRCIANPGLNRSGLVIDRVLWVETGNHIDSVFSHRRSRGSGGGRWRRIEGGGGRELNSGEEEPVVVSGVFVGFVDWNIAFSAEDGSVLLAEQECFSLLNHKGKLSTS